MRISDWSSDVCSSDLLKPAKFAFEQGPGLRLESRKDERIGGDVLQGCRRLRNKRVIAWRNENAFGWIQRGEIEAQRCTRVRRHGNVGAAEIGRAACSDRVCQYV